MPTLSLAQLSINYPYNRQIFQRNNNNEAEFSVLGNCPSTASLIRYQLIPVQANQGTAIAWTDLDTNPIGGFYQGKIKAKGGWYSLKIKLISNGIDTDSITLSRVGVGENFIIAGQSNAQGTTKYPGDVGAVDDRVNSASFSNGVSTVSGSNDDFLPIPNGSFDYPENVYRQISSNAIIGPTGGTNYYWANLGDSLAKKYNVPICFFNAALGGTSIRNWSESSRGILTENPWVNGLYYQAGYPYMNLKKVAEIYGKKNGIRAVLWHNGETDSNQKMLPSVYKSHLKELISNFRKDIGDDIPWVIAQASFYATRLDNGTCVVDYNSQIADAQLEFLSDSNLMQLFQGPSTDNIEIPRNNDLDAYCVHFSRKYFVQVANSWLNKINTVFLTNSKPSKGLLLPTISKDCGPNNANRIAINSTASKVSLYNSSNQFIGSILQYTNLDPDTYSILLEDSLGLKFKMPSFRVKNFSLNPALALNVTKDSTYCDGSISELFVKNDYKTYRWISGDTTKSIKLLNSGTYQVQVVDKNSCVSTSNLIKLTKLPKPNKPIIVANSNTVFCDGFKADVMATNGQGKYEWNTGDKTQLLSVRKSMYVKVVTINSNNCKSDYSDSLKITALPLPVAPNISANSDTLFCDGKSVELLAKNGAEKLIWSTGESLSKIIVAKSGTYSVATIDTNKCQSKPSKNIYVTVWPNPKSPNIIAMSDTIFCDGGNVKLLATNGAGRFEWNSGQTVESVTIAKTGMFSVKTIDKNQCISPLSKPIYVKVNPNPVRPIINSIGDTLICSGKTVELVATNGATKFVWKTGEITQSIIVNKAGIFQVSTIDDNNCKSEFSNPVKTKLYASPAPTSITMSSPYYLYGGLKLIDTEYLWTLNKLNFGENGAYLRVFESGKYGIAVVKKYVNGPTCLSSVSEYNYKVPEDGGLTIYPNPAKANDLVNIQSISNLKNATYVLYAFDGRQMLSGKINEDGIYGFNVSELGDGKYFLILNADNHLYKKALMISR